MSNYNLKAYIQKGALADHRLLTNRDKPNQHPISSITGLEAALNNAGTTTSKTYTTIAEIQADWENLGAGLYTYIVLDGVTYTSGGAELTRSAVLERRFLSSGGVPAPLYESHDPDGSDYIFPFGEGISLKTRIGAVSSGANGALILTPEADYVSMDPTWVPSAVLVLDTLTAFENTVEVPIRTEADGIRGTAVLGHRHGMAFGEALDLAAGAAAWAVSDGTVTITTN